MHDTDALRLVNALSAIDLRLQLLEEDDLTPSQASQSRLARHALRTQIETIRRLDRERDAALKSLPSLRALRAVR